MKRIRMLLKCAIFVAALLPFSSQLAEATHCYIGRNVTRASDGSIIVNWTNVYQSPTPRLPRGWSIAGAWYNNQTPGGMSAVRCEKMVRYKAQQNRSSAPLVGKCLRNYFNGLQVSTTCR